MIVIPKKMGRRRKPSAQHSAQHTYGWGSRYVQTRSTTGGNWRSQGRAESDKLGFVSLIFVHYGRALWSCLSKPDARCRFMRSTQPWKVCGQIGPAIVGHYEERLPWLSRTEHQPKDRRIAKSSHRMAKLDGLKLCNPAFNLTGLPRASTDEVSIPIYFPAAWAEWTPVRVKVRCCCPPKPECRGNPTNRPNHPSKFFRLANTTPAFQRDQAAALEQGLESVRSPVMKGVRVQRQQLSSFLPPKSWSVGSLH